MWRAPFPCQRSRSHGSFEIFVVCAPWLPPDLTESLHMWHIYMQHMRGQCFTSHIQDERSVVKVTLVISNFGPVRSLALSLFG